MRDKKTRKKQNFYAEKFNEEHLTNNTGEHVAAAGRDSNTKFESSDGLAENLLKSFSNFKAVMDFLNLEIVHFV